MDVASRTLGLRAEVAEIKHCILSMACLQDTGWSARFGDDGCELRRGTFCIPLRRRGYLYVIEAKLRQLLCNEAPVGLPVEQEVIGRELILSSPTLLLPEDSKAGERHVDEDVPAPREIPLPLASFVVEGGQHELAHLPFRIWCASCYLARARDDACTALLPEMVTMNEVDGKDLIQSDYVYLDNIKTLPVWVATEHLVAVTVVSQEGSTVIAVKWLQRKLKSFRVGRARFRTNQEVLAVTQEKWWCPTIFEYLLAHRHQSMENTG